MLDRIIWRTWSLTRAKTSSKIRAFQYHIEKILEYAEEILNVNTIESASPSWTRSTLSHDQVIKWTKKVRFHSDPVQRLGKMYLHVNVQRHRLEKEKERWNLYFEFRGSQRIRQKNSREDIGRSSALDTKRSGMGVSPTSLQEKWETTDTELVERFKDTCHPQTLQCGCFRHTALVPNQSFCT